MTLSARSRPWSLGGRATVARQYPFRFASRLRRWLAARWRHLTSGRVLSAGLCAQLPFERGERILAAGRDPGHGPALAATDRALYYRGADDDWSRLGWEQITRVHWDTAARCLVIAGLTGLAPRRTVLPLRARGTLPELAEERITHTKLGRWQVSLPGNHHVLVEARRRPATGQLLWVVICDGDRLDLSDADVRGQIERALARLGEDFGVTPPVTLPPPVR